MDREIKTDSLTRLLESMPVEEEKVDPLEEPMREKIRVAYVVNAMNNKVMTFAVGDNESDFVSIQISEDGKWLNVWRGDGKSERYNMKYVWKLNVEYTLPETVRAKTKEENLESLAIEVRKNYPQLFEEAV